MADHPKKRKLPKEDVELQRERGDEMPDYQHPELRNAGAAVDVNLNVDDDESMTLEESLAKVAMLLARTDNPKVLSEIDDKEIRLCASLLTVAERMNDKMISNFVNNFLLLRVSNRRKGRTELLEIARGVKEMPEQRFSRLRNLFGMGNRQGA